jgi:hypothetical protein
VAALAVVAALALVPMRAADAGIAVVRAGPWSAGDLTREGASQFSVWLELAKERKEHRLVGMIGVGDRHGLFPQGSEQALKFIAAWGVPVVKLTRGGDLAAEPAGIFIDGCNLNESEAAVVLTRCLERFGESPLAADPNCPTTAELSAIRRHLIPFRQAFMLAAAQRVAAR